ncbi:MAG: aminotransferase class I/II-fold pyridoxal phosphate-dependent enzyme [Bdellovibrionales bacterium]|nr:aminotransferase class I/II-fold pyridoxal phosphate-dependent enzyme [Bdellovibrionales bacterium]
MSREDQNLRDIQHFGEEGGVVPVVDVAATSTFLDPKDMDKTFHSELEGCYLYSRHSNPTVMAFSKKIAAMEGMPAALGVASGMAAISSSILQLTGGEGHVVSSHVVYGGTYALFANVLPRWGVQTSFVNTQDLDAVESSIRPDTKVLYVESLSNPMLAVAHLQSLSKLAKKYNLKLVVDNTFTPLVISPAKHGADVVVYSCTKYISGASDLIAGAIVGSQDFINSLIDLNHGVVMLTGPVMDARIAHELYVRLDHLPVRMRAHSEAAMFFAKNVEEQGVKVVYPGLESHPHHENMKELMNPSYGFGGMVMVDCGSIDRATRIAEQLQNEKFGLFAVSLGFSRTLMSIPASSTSSEIPEEEQKKMGLMPGLLRLSIGFVGDNEVLLKKFLDCYNEQE